MITTYKNIDLKELSDILKPMGINIDGQIEQRETLITFVKKWYPNAVKAKFVIAAQYNDENYYKGLDSILVFDKDGKPIEELDNDNDKYCDERYNLINGDCGDYFEETIEIDLTKELLNLCIPPQLLPFTNFGDFNQNIIGPEGVKLQIPIQTITD